VEAVTQSSQSTELLLANKEMAAVQEKLEAKKVLSLSLCYSQA